MTVLREVLLEKRALISGNAHKLIDKSYISTVIEGSEMDIKWVEDFQSLAVTRNFSRSADHRNVTQPTFSRRIRALEVWVGSELVDRSTYPLTLTAAGKLFYDTASEAIRMLNDARAQVRIQQTVHQGSPWIRS